MTGGLPAVELPSGPAYTVLLLCHIAAVLVGLVAIAASAIAGARVLVGRGRPLGPSVRRYFAPGVNWTGRVFYLVPVFGVGLVAMSGGAYPIGATWVLWGFGLWGLAMAVAEVVLWPAERRAQQVLVGTGTPAGEVPAAARRACRTMCWAAAAVLAIVVAAMIVMFAKP